MPKLLIGTRNKGKFEKWKLFLKEFDLYSLDELGINCEIEEDLVSLEKNSQKKALFYAKESGIVTLSEDIGLYFEALDGKPGVAIRRWGGELPVDVSNRDFFEFFKKKMKDLDNTNCYFQEAVSIATSEGKVKTFFHKVEGRIDKSLFENEFIEGFPLAAVFFRNGSLKSWMDFTPEEKFNLNKNFIEKIKRELNKFL
ncbi:MAG: non-canonical purine NTP pyrophosphatase [Candidatus Nanoarchaeia archaeon]|nr:non-canonical purine NTP pyrophosphatase [Candidatus Nanoarchaeia archaeon]